MTAIEQLRNNIGDPDREWFTDDELEALLETASDSIARATGYAIRQLAKIAAMTGKSIQTNDLKLDDSKRGATLLEIAQSWIDEADKEDEKAGADFFNIVGFPGFEGDRTRHAEATAWPFC